MGFSRASSAILVANLAGVGPTGCATHPADQQDSTRLQRLASSLAVELEAAGPDDPRVMAAAADLQMIAGYAPGAPAPVAFHPWEPIAPMDAAALVPLDAPVAALAPLARLAPASLAAAAPVEAPASMGLALGRFTDAAMASVMWREIQGLDSAALTGLSGFTVRDDHGVVLMAGPVAGAQSAEERCMALTVWGLNCTPAAWPSGAQAVSGGGA